MHWHWISSLKCFLPSSLSSHLLITLLLILSVWFSQSSAPRHGYNRETTLQMDVVRIMAAAQVLCFTMNATQFGGNSWFTFREGRNLINSCTMTVLWCMQNEMVTTENQTNFVLIFRQVISALPTYYKMGINFESLTHKLFYTSLSFPYATIYNEHSFSKPLKIFICIPVKTRIWPILWKKTQMYPKGT